MFKKFSELLSGDVFMYAGNKYLATSTPMTVLEDGSAQDTLLCVFLKPVVTDKNLGYSFVQPNPKSVDGNYDIYCDARSKVEILHENTSIRQVVLTND